MFIKETDNQNGRLERIKCNYIYFHNEGTPNVGLTRLMTCSSVYTRVHRASLLGRPERPSPTRATGQVEETRFSQLRMLLLSATHFMKKTSGEAKVVIVDSIWFQSLLSFRGYLPNFPRSSIEVLLQSSFRQFGLVCEIKIT